VRDSPPQFIRSTDILLTAYYVYGVKSSWREEPDVLTKGWLYRPLAEEISASSGSDE
jgi:hypothetical protein